MRACETSYTEEIKTHPYACNCEYTASQWATQATRTTCSCGEPFRMENMQVTPSDAGYPVYGMEQKQWITMMCLSKRCDPFQEGYGQETALWKLGVPRPGHPEDIR